MNLIPGFRWRRVVRVASCLAILAPAVVVPLTASGAGKSRPKTGPKSIAGAAKGEGQESAAASSSAESTDETIKLPDQILSTGYEGPATELLAFINGQIRQGWVD